MKLENIIDHSKTDKGSTHSYVPFYQHKLEGRRDKVKKVLEVGIERGGSLLLWEQFFPDAMVYGMDIMSSAPECLKGHKRIATALGVNAYDKRMIDSLRRDAQFFDLMVDDGPHTLESMLFFARHFSQFLAPGGLLVIEDIPDPEWVHYIFGAVPEHLKKFCEAYDFRTIKRRHDDIIFVIDFKHPELPVQGSRMTL
jgi:hypothetical protein